MQPDITPESSAQEAFDYSLETLVLANNYPPLWHVRRWWRHHREVGRRLKVFEQYNPFRRPPDKGEA